MAVLDVQFSRGTLCYGHSTSYDSDEEMVVPALHAVACLLRHDTGEPTEPLVGSVLKPVRFRAALARESDCFEPSAYSRIPPGGNVRPSRDACHLVVVLDGHGVLHAGDGVHELGPGSLALLPGRSVAELHATSELEVLTYPLD